MKNYTLLILLVIVNNCYADSKASVLEDGLVVRAQFTTGIKDKEPIDKVITINDKYHSIYFFTEVKLFEDKIVSHKWTYNNKTYRINNFMVKGPRWRMYSMIDLPDGMYGLWTVYVTNNEGKPYKAAIFEYVSRNQKPPLIKANE